MDRNKIQHMLSVMLFAVLAVGLVMGSMVSEPESATAKPSQCQSGHLCNEVSFTVNVEDFDLLGFRYDVKSWASEDGRRGCHALVDLSQPQLFYGGSVLSFSADLADGAKAEVGVQYARVELHCRDGRISYRDITRRG